jgi:hypothetical protein
VVGAGAVGGGADKAVVVGAGRVLVGCDVGGVVGGRRAAVVVVVEALVAGAAVGGGVVVVAASSGGWRSRDWPMARVGPLPVATDVDLPADPGRPPTATATPPTTRRSATSPIHTTSPRTPSLPIPDTMGKLLAPGNGPFGSFLSSHRERIDTLDGRAWFVVQLRLGVQTGRMRSCLDSLYDLLNGGLGSRRILHDDCPNSTPTRPNPMLNSKRSRGRVIVVIVTVVLLLASVLWIWATSSADRGANPASSRTATGPDWCEAVSDTK